MKHTVADALLFIARPEPPKDFVHIRSFIQKTSSCAGRLQKRLHCIVHLLGDCTKALNVVPGQTGTRQQIQFA